MFRSGDLSAALLAIAALVVPARRTHDPLQESHPMKLTSPAFEDQERIPQRYTADGKDISPPLEWSSVPQGTAQLALIVDDPDAPRPQPWVHWVIYGISAEARGLPEAVPAGPRVARPPAVQGQNSWDAGTLGYRGPSPPPGHGPHHYRFVLYALDQPVQDKPGLSKDELLQAMRDHVLQQALLTGIYERPAGAK